jgi:polyhydroxyalkanoate synthesis regulator phasin
MIMPLDEPQEVEPLLQFYRVRYHQMMHNQTTQERMIKELRQEVEALKHQLKALKHQLNS